VPGAKDRLIRATAWHAAGRIAAAVFGLATMGYSFSALGAERYGLLGIVAVAALALAMVEFGLKTATVHFVAEDAARGDRNSLDALLATATAIHLGAGLLVAIPFALLAESLARWFDVPDALQGEAVVLLRVMAGALVVGNIAYSWTAVLVGLQRTGPVAGAMVAGTAAQLLVTVLAVEAGRGAEALGTGFLAGTVVRAAIERAAARRAMPGLTVVPWRASRAALRRVADLGWSLQAVRVADVFVFQLDQILVTRLLGVGVGGVYRVANELVLKLRDAPLLLTSGVLPAATEVRDADGGRAVQNLYVRGTRYLVAAATPGAFFIIVMSPALVRLAGGDEAAGAALPLALLTAGYLANVCAGVGTQVGMVIGQARLQAVAAGISSVAALVLVPTALAAGFGTAGAAGATAVALWLGPLWYISPLHRALGVQTATLLRTAFAGAVPAAAVAALSVGWVHYAFLAEMAATLARSGLLALVAVEAVATAVLFALLLWAFRWADDFDRDMLKRLRALPRGGRAAS
jgi:O-antigen/teichoic acid export membrane protein